MSAGQPELPIDPPAEPENDPELTSMLEAAYGHKHWLQRAGLDMAGAKLLTEEEDAEWEYAFGCFELLLKAAAGRVAAVSAERREAAADDG